MNTQHKPIWILVADSAQARIYSTENSTADWAEVATLSHPEARLHERQLDSDVSGCNRAKFGGGHVYDEIISPKEQENVYFASHITDYLTSALNRNQFGSLYVVASPEFLGDLRHAFGEQLQKHVVFSLDKNLINHSVHTLRGHLPLTLA
jgi:protein required for attachment to host cells